MTVAGVVAAQRKRSEKQLIEELRSQSALSAATAVPLHPERRIQRAALRSLVRHGAVLQTHGGLYWLNEAAYAAMRARRRRFIIATIGLFLVISAIAIAFVFVSAR